MLTDNVENIGLCSPKQRHAEMTVQSSVSSGNSLALNYSDERHFYVSNCVFQ